MAVEPSTKVWLSDPNLVERPPPKARGRPRQRVARAALPPAQDLAAVARALPTRVWRQFTWRHGSKGPMTSRLAKVPVWAAHRPPGPEAVRAREWLLIEWPQGAAAPTDYWLCQLAGVEAGLRRLIRLARARWRVELDYRELKEELGLDHYEGRGWLGWHHHVTLVSMAFGFLRSEQARAKKNGWCDVAPDALAPASRAPAAGRPLPLVPDPL